MSQKKPRCPHCKSTKLEILEGASRVIDSELVQEFRLSCTACSGAPSKTWILLPLIAATRPQDLMHRLLYEWKVDLGLERHWSEDFKGVPS